MKENSSEEVIAATSSDSVVAEHKARPSKKSKSSPSNSEEFAGPRSSGGGAAAQSVKQVADSTQDQKPLKDNEKQDDRTLKWRTLEKNEESSDTAEDHKTKPVKFIIKKKNALCASTVMDRPLKKPAVVHPSILLAQKIAARDLPLKTNRKNQAGQKETDKEDNVQTAKTKDSEEEASGPPVAASEPDTSLTKNKLKDRELLRAYEILKNSLERDKKEKAGARQKQPKRKTASNSSDSKPISRLHKPDKREILPDKDEQKKDISEKRRKEQKMYEDFIRHRSNEWKRSKLKYKDSIDKSTLKSEASSDEDHAKPSSEDVRPEQPKEEALEDNLNSCLPSQVPHRDSAKVLEPLPESELINDNTVYPKPTDMEIDEEELITEIANFRDSTSYFSLTPSNSLCAPTTHYSSGSIYIVVDTNVLIRDADFLEQLKSSTVDGREIIIVVPYVVLQEMDGLKKSASIGHACQAAVKWCNKHFEAQDPRVLGQTYSNYRNSLEKNRKAVSSSNSSNSRNHHHFI